MADQEKDIKGVIENLANNQSNAPAVKEELIGRHDRKKTISLIRYVLQKMEDKKTPYVPLHYTLIALYNSLELLSDQEPRVMTICEIQSFDGAVYVDEPKNPVCLKMLYCYEVGQRTCGHGYTFVDSDGDKVFYSAQGFGTKWRCWTSRPTDEQRKEVKWDG